jgi:hypothetical protein
VTRRNRTGIRMPNAPNLSTAHSLVQIDKMLTKPEPVFRPKHYVFTLQSPPSFWIEISSKSRSVESTGDEQGLWLRPSECFSICLCQRLDHYQQARRLLMVLGNRHCGRAWFKRRLLRAVTESTSSSQIST